MMDIKMCGKKRRQNLNILFELNDNEMVNGKLDTFLIYFTRSYFISVSLFNGAGWTNVTCISN